MKVSGKLSYKSAIIVNDVFFKDIDELLREYFEKGKSLEDKILKSLEGLKFEE